MRRIKPFTPNDIVNFPNGNGRIAIGAPNAGSKILFYNLSPYNLEINFLNGNQSMLHAWEARPWTLDGETPELEWIIDSSVNPASPPISIVYGELYNPTEPIEGTYPMALMHQTAVGGSVSTAVTSSNQLLNTGNPTGTNVATVSSTAAAGNTWTLTNDGLFALAVTIAGALQTVLQTFEPAAGGKILQEGVATYLTEQMGNLKVDGTLESVGALTADTNINMANAVYLQAKDSGAVLRGLLSLSAANHAILRAGGGQCQLQLLDGTIVLGVDAGGLNFSSKKLFDTSGNNLADWSATGMFLKGGPTANGPFNYQGNRANTDWQIGAACKFSGSGTVTVNHTMVQFNASVGPDWVAPVVNVSGSATMGYDTVTSTQVHVTAGAALGWHAWGLK